MKLTIGENIRHFRKKNDLTQEALAECLGVTYQSISRWENGTTYPDLELIPAIAEEVMSDAGLPLLRHRAFPRKLKVCFDHKTRSCSPGRTAGSGRNADGTSEADAVLAINAGD